MGTRTLRVICSCSLNFLFSSEEMGDKVQHVLESFLPTLLALKENEIFTEKEIKKIIKKRRYYEYRLATKQCDKEDMLNYIEYETNLEFLRLKREKLKGLKTKTLRSTSSIKHLLKLFSRAVRIWPQDKKLWNQYIDFCFQSGCTRKVMFLFLQALAHHPHELNYWLLASQRELHLGHIEGPRRLLLLALRQMPTSLYVWEEYIKLEIRILLRQLCYKSNETNNKNVGVYHLIVIIKKAVDQLSLLDSCCFMAYTLDWVAVLFSDTIVSYLSDISILDKTIMSILQEQSEKEPLMKLFCWKLENLSILKSDHFYQISISDFLLKFQKNQINCPYTWCCLMLFFDNLIFTCYRGFNICEMNTLDEMLHKQDQPLFTLTCDINEEKEEMVKENMFCPIQYISPDFFRWLHDRKQLVWRCLIFSTDKNILQGCWSDDVKKDVNFTHIPPTFVCHQLKTELFEFTRLLKKSSINEKLISKEELLKLYQWMCSVSFENIKSETCFVLTCLLNLYKSWNLEITGSIYLNQLQNVLKNFKTLSNPIHCLHSKVLNIYIKMLLNQEIHLFQKSHTNTIVKKLKLCSQVSKKDILLIIIIGSFNLQQLHETFLKNPGCKKKIQKEIMFLYPYLTQCMDAFYSSCYIQDLFFICQSLCNFWFYGKTSIAFLSTVSTPSTTLSSKNSNTTTQVTKQLVNMEFQRIVATKTYGMMMIPVARQIVKRVISIMFLSNQIYSMYCDLKENQLNESNPIEEKIEDILKGFHIILECIFSFEKDATQFHKMTSSLVDFIPSNLTFKTFLLRYVSFVLTLEQLLRFEIIPLHFNNKILQKERNQFLQNLHDILRQNILLWAAYDKCLLEQLTSQIAFSEIEQCKDLKSLDNLENESQQMFLLLK